MLADTESGSRQTPAVRYEIAEAVGPRLTHTHTHTHTLYCTVLTNRTLGRLERFHAALLYHEKKTLEQDSNHPTGERRESHESPEERVSHDAVFPNAQAYNSLMHPTVLSSNVEYSYSFLKR